MEFEYLTSVQDNYNVLHLWTQQPRRRILWKPKQGDRQEREGDSPLLVVGGDWNAVMSPLPIRVNPELIDAQSIPNTINAEKIMKIVVDHYGT